jgi:TP901 family phage tail tape measure protein
MAVLTSKLIVSLIDQFTAPARGVARSVKDLQRASRANAMQLNDMRGRMLDTAAAAYVMARALSAPVQKAIEFESAMADVAKVSGFDASGLDEFGRDLRDLARSEIPMAVTELAALAENAAASGVGDADLVDFTRMTAKAALAWGVSGAQAGEDLAKLREALRLSTAETMAYADAINHLSDQTASTAPDLTNFARRVASQGEFYGFSKEQSLAFGSAMISAGAETEVAATSFRNMGRALTKGAGATKSVKEAYRTLGLDSGKVAKAMQEDAVGTTLEVVKRLGQLPEYMQATVMSDLFGDEARALAPLLNNVELLERTLGLVSDETAYAGSVQAEFARRAATTEFNLQRLKNQVDDVAMAIGNALLPAINAAAAAVGPWLGAMSDWIAANPHIVQAIAAMLGGLVALRVVTLASRWAFLFLKGAVLDTALMMVRGAIGFLALINPLNLVKNAVMALRMALMLSGIGLVLAAVAAAGTWIYNNWEGLGAFFEALGSAMMAALEPLMPVIQPVIDAGQKILDWVTGLLGPVDASAEDWAGWGNAVGTAVGEAIVAVVERGQAIIDWFAELPTHIATGVSGMADAVIQQFADIGQRIAEAFQSIDWVGIGVSLMNSIWEGMKSIIPNMVEGLGSAIAGLNPFGGGAAPVVGPAPQYNPAYPDLPVPMTVPGKAVGGSILGGKTYLVGEYGPELITPGRGGYVHTADETAAMLGQSGRSMPPVSVSFGNIIVPGGQDPRATAEEVMRTLEAKLREAMGGIFADVEFGG